MMGDQIMGGASGIGRATAELWVADGGHAVVCVSRESSFSPSVCPLSATHPAGRWAALGRSCDINDEKGEAFQAEMPGKVTFVHCDTTSRCASGPRRGGRAQD